MAELRHRPDRSAKKVTTRRLSTSVHSFANRSVTRPAAGHGTLPYDRIDALHVHRGQRRAQQAGGRVDRPPSIALPELRMLQESGDGVSSRGGDARRIEALDDRSSRQRREDLGDEPCRPACAGRAWCSRRTGRPAPVRSLPSKAARRGPDLRLEQQCRTPCSSRMGRRNRSSRSFYENRHLAPDQLHANVRVAVNEHVAIAGGVRSEDGF